MGYDLNKFVDIQDISTQLRCLICSLVLQDPLQSPCEHSFCNQCITIYLQSSNHCPHYDEDSVSVKSSSNEKKKASPLKKISSFRKIIGKSPKDKFPILKLSDLKVLPTNLLNELNSLKVYCDYHLNGCTQKLTLSTLSDHLKQCEYIDQSSQKQQEQEEQNNKQLAKSDNLKQQQEQQKTNKSTSSTTVEHQHEEIISVKETITTGEMSESTESKQESNTNVQRKDSVENKSVNSEHLKSTMVSEEEVGSDDFVVIPKNVKANSSSTKSTESVQSSNDPVSSESKENLNNQTESNVDKKKKKKKKKKNTNAKATTDEDAVSLDTASLKGVESSSGGLNSGVNSKTQSKESIAEQEELKRTLKDLENKNENLRLINNQLLGQIKQLKDEKEEFNKKLQTQLETSGEVDELKNKMQQLEKVNKTQTLRIIQLLDSNENMNKFIMTLRDEQAQLKEKYNATLNDVQQISKLVKSCKQEIIN